MVDDVADFGVVLDFAVADYGVVGVVLGGVGVVLDLAVLELVVYDHVVVGVVLNLVQTFAIALPCFALRMLRVQVVVELAPVSVRAIQVLVEVFALLCSVILMNVLFGQQLVFTVGKSAFGAKFAF